MLQHQNDTSCILHCYCHSIVYLQGVRCKTGCIPARSMLQNWMHTSAHCNRAQTIKQIKRPMQSESWREAMRCFHCYARPFAVLRSSILCGHRVQGRCLQLPRDAPPLLLLGGCLRLPPAPAQRAGVRRACLRTRARKCKRDMLSSQQSAGRHMS